MSKSVGNEIYLGNTNRQVFVLAGNFQNARFILKEHGLHPNLRNVIVGLPGNLKILQGRRVSTGDICLLGTGVTTEMFFDFDLLLSVNNKVINHNTGIIV